MKKTDIYEEIRKNLLAIQIDDKKGDKEYYKKILSLLHCMLGGQNGMLVERQTNSGNLREVCRFGEIEDMLSHDIKSMAQYLIDHPDNNDAMINTDNAADHQTVMTKKSVKRGMIKEILLFPIVTKGNILGAAYLGSAVESNLQIHEKNVLREYGRIAGEFIETKNRVSFLEKQNQSLRQNTKNAIDFEDLLGTSEGIKRVRNSLKLVSETDIPVCLIGEKGTGKEFIANIIHSESGRTEEPFVEFDCSEVPDELIAAELFGQHHTMKGSPKNGRIGAIQKAQGGTLLISNIEHLSVDVQKKLVLAIDNREMTPLGDLTSYYVNIRLIISTGANIKELFINNIFCEPFYLKLMQFPILLAPLKDRLEDFPLLVSHFVDDIASEYGKSIGAISPDVYDHLCQYEWPGNIDELKKEIRQAILRTGNRSEQLSASDFSSHLLSGKAEAVSNLGEGTLKQRLARIERKLLIDSLDQFNHNQSLTADSLGLSRQALINKLQRYNIETGRAYKQKMREIEQQAEKSQ